MAGGIGEQPLAAHLKAFVVEGNWECSLRLHAENLLLLPKTLIKKSNCKGENHEKEIHQF